MRKFYITLAYLFITSLLVFAGEANVLEVRIEKTDDGYFNVHTTVQHDDEGFEHYADRWEILDLEDNLLDTRILTHPHSAAPFTRSIIKANIPEGINMIRVRAHDNVHGYGGKIVEVIIPED